MAGLTKSCYMPRTIFIYWRLRLNKSETHETWDKSKRFVILIPLYPSRFSDVWDKNWNPLEIIPHFQPSEHCNCPKSRIIVKKSIVLSHNSQSEPWELWDKMSKSQTFILLTSKIHYQNGQICRIKSAKIKRLSYILSYIRIVTVKWVYSYTF